MANTYSLDLESGSSQYSSIADGSQTGLDLAGDFTIEGWFNYETLPSNGNVFYFVNKQNTVGDQRAYTIYHYNNAGTYEWRAIIDQDGDAVTRDGYHWDWTPTTATWYHVAIVCDISEASATTFEFFRNAATQGNGTAIAGHADNCASIKNSSDPFYVGSGAGGASYFDGKVNSLRVWSDKRSAAEIIANWKTSTPAGDNLQGSWYYNNDHLDDSGKGNTLTASGSPVFSTDVPYNEAGFLPIL